jgi:NAD-dependent DNA ligase
MSFGRLFANEAHKLRKSCESLIGICSGLLADEELNEAEVRFLDHWLRDHEDIVSVWPGDVIAKRVREVLADGIVTKEELEHLKQTLKDLIGGTLQDTGATNGLATRLPVNDDCAIPVNFRDTAFCFTGNFLFGTRSACERAVLERGAQILTNIKKSLGYLVIGTMVSSEWANSSHGRKIEKAINYQQAGSTLLIISEEHWIKYIT